LEKVPTHLVSKIFDLCKNLCKIWVDRLSVADWSSFWVKHPPKTPVSVVNELSMALLNHRKLHLENSSKLQNDRSKTFFIVHAFLDAVAFIRADFRICVDFAGESVTSMMVVARLANVSNPVFSSL
jgi:hypothetical protein